MEALGFTYHKIFDMTSKPVSDSLTVMTEIVLPNDTNNLNNLFGGQLLSWMDRCAAIAAHRHCGRIVVTASVNNVSFQRPIPQGSIVTLEARVSRTFNSSLEIFVDVFLEANAKGKRLQANEAIYTFVAVDQLGNPIQVPPVVPETDIEKKRYDGALRRKQLALILAGKMDPNNATELRALFFPDEEKK